MSKTVTATSLVILALAGCSSIVSDEQPAFGKFDRIDAEVAIDGSLGAGPLPDLGFDDVAAVDPWSADRPTAAETFPTVSGGTLSHRVEPPSGDIVTYVFDDSDMTDDGLGLPEEPPEL